MKKALFVLITVLLLTSCKSEIIKKENINIIEPIESGLSEDKKYDYLENKVLDNIIKKSNEITNIIDIELLHNRLIKDLNLELNKEKSIDEQKEKIESIVKKSLLSWKKEVIKEIINDNDFDVNDDDLDYIINKTSINDVYRVMLAYEIIYLKKIND